MGYGSDPNLINPHVSWSRILSDRQKQIIACLSDIILPATDYHPAPTALGIVDFFDEWLSAPYTQQQADRELLLVGLAWIDTEAHTRFGVGFVEATSAQQRDLIDFVAVDGPAPDQLRKFFKRLRYLVVGGYYTTDAGMLVIGYIGNVPKRSFPTITAEVQRIIDDEARRLEI
jgi:hypothetical protein